MMTRKQQTITGFNIEAQYDDYKLRFHAICTPQYINIWSKKITDWLQRP